MCKAEVTLYGSLPDIDGWSEVANILRKKLTEYSVFNEWEISIMDGIEGMNKEYDAAGYFVIADPEKKTFDISIKPRPVKNPENTADIIFEDIDDTIEEYNDEEE